MSEDRLRNMVEAALLAAGRPLQISDLVAIADEAERPSAAEVRSALQSLALQFEGRGIELAQVAGGYRIQVRSEWATQIARLWPEKAPRFSRAMLETIALIAYRQPITRAEIEAVRGVAVNPNIVRTLVERGWVKVVGHRDVPGHPELLGTTRDFLDYFGLARIDELPPLAEIRSMLELDPQLDLPGTEIADPGPDAGDSVGELAVEGTELCEATDDGNDEESTEDQLCAEVEASSSGLVASGSENHD
ncbi:MAG: SMC-Scp complex subunit ScpB [Steroidobacteraceae bacterium]